MIALHNIDAATVADWLKNGSAILLDTRESDAREDEFIDAAEALPLSRIQGLELPADNDQVIVVVSEGGQLPARAISFFEDKGITNIFNLTNGIDGWKQAGFPVCSADKSELDQGLAGHLTWARNLFWGHLLQRGKTE